jgi:hypothetical protein
MTRWISDTRHQRNLVLLKQAHDLLFIDYNISAVAVHPCVAGLEFNPVDLARLADATFQALGVISLLSCSL